MKINTLVYRTHYILVFPGKSTPLVDSRSIGVILFGGVSRTVDSLGAVLHLHFFRKATSRHHLYGLSRFVQQTFLPSFTLHFRAVVNNGDNGVVVMVGYALSLL